jgi:hypothetical protein
VYNAGPRLLAAGKETLINLPTLSRNPTVTEPSTKKKNGFGPRQECRHFALARATA